ncbi:MAG: hypothetical protein HRT72_05855 [Flavobacteriales bacterium]|nr:hypothetical protein [Flavobacteriales bacterium]
MLLIDPIIITNRICKIVKVLCGIITITLFSGCSFFVANENMDRDSYYLAINISKMKVDKELYPEKWEARNYLLFLLLNQRMTFVDLATLKKEHINEATYKGSKLIEASITYKHNKNGMLITTPLDRISIQVLNDYKVGKKLSSEYIFPIDFDKSTEGFRTYNNSRKHYLESFKNLAVEVNWGSKFRMQAIRNHWYIYINNYNEAELSETN